MRSRSRELDEKNKQAPNCCGKPMLWQPAGLCWHCSTCNRSKQLRPLAEFESGKK